MNAFQTALGGVVDWWNRQAMVMRAGLLGVLGIVIGAILAVGFLSGDSGGSNDLVARTPTPVPTATPTPQPTVTPTATHTATSTPTATPEPTETPEPTPTPEPSITSLADLVRLYGYPPGYDYAHLRIPKLGVDAPVARSLVTSGVMDTPEGPATVLWYDLSGWEGLGGAPGEGKNAIFSGHVDIASYVPYADVTYVGPGVFSGLKLLVPGDRIYVDINGETLEYQVVWERQIPANSDGWGEIWSSDVETDSITLYTCGGEFDVTQRSYVDRVVLRAERVS